MGKDPRKLGENEKKFMGLRWGWGHFILSCRFTLDEFQVGSS